MKIIPEDWCISSKMRDELSEDQEEDDPPVKQVDEVVIPVGDDLVVEPLYLAPQSEQVEAAVPVLQADGPPPVQASRCSGAETVILTAAETTATPPVGKYACETCGMWLANKTSLEMHLRSHAGFRPFSCDKCEKTFTSREGSIGIIYDN